MLNVVAQVQPYVWCNCCLIHEAIKARIPSSIICLNIYRDAACSLELMANISDLSFNFWRFQYWPNMLRKLDEKSRQFQVPRWICYFGWDVSLAVSMYFILFQLKRLERKNKLNLANFLYGIPEKFPQGWANSWQS